MSPTPADGPDVGQLRKQALPEAAFPGGQGQAVRLFFEPRAHADVARHAGEDTTVEICGVLVGRCACDAGGPFVLVSDTIRGEAAANKFAEVTFTHDTWARINQQMDTRFAGLSIVGWYHSHPDFGVFLSDRDRFIQEHFFSGPGQLAYVVDPVRKSEGVFLWRQGKPALWPHYWVGDRVQVSTAAGEETARDKAPSPAEAPPPGASPRHDSSWLSVLTQASLALCLFLLGFLLAGKLSDLDRLRVEQGALGRAWLYLKLRPGLGDELDVVRQDLDQASRGTTTLAKQQLKLADVPKETQEQWRDVLVRLEKALRRLEEVRATYSLTPEELRLLEALGDVRSRGSLGEAGPGKDRKGSPDQKPPAAPPESSKPANGKS